MIVLYSAKRCPFAFRTRLVLQEKQLDYQHIEIDLGNKPAEFLRISRYGKVPALIDGDSHIYESAIINEYLDEQYPEPALMPKTPAERAYARIWIDFANTRLMPASYRVAFGRTEQDKEAARGEFAKYIAMVGEELAQGPWFSGDSFSLVDVTYAPFFSRLSRFEGIDIPTNVIDWLHRIAARPAYERAVGALATSPTS